MPANYEGQTPVDRPGATPPVFTGLSFWKYNVTPKPGQKIKKGRLGINFPKGTDVRDHTDNPQPPYEVETAADGTVIVHVDVPADTDGPVTINVVSPTDNKGGKSGTLSIEQKPTGATTWTVLETELCTIPLQISQAPPDRRDTLALLAEYEGLKLATVLFRSTFTQFGAEG